MKTANKFMLVVAMMFCLITTGCFLTAAAAVFPAIAAVVSDATAVLNIVQQASNSWFMHKPDHELQAQVDNSITETWNALRVATAATKGAESLSQEEYDQAFLEFQTAYTRLHALLKEHGILKGNKLSSGPNQPEHEIPEPLAMSFKVSE